MWKRGVLPLVCFIFIVTSANGQLSFGLKTALSLSFAKTEALYLDDTEDFLLYEVHFKEEDVSPSFGVFGIMRDNDIFIQSELLYRNISSNFEYIIWENNPPVMDVDVKRTHFIAWPIMGGFQVQNFKFSTGPIFSFIIAENEIFKNFKHFSERREWLESGFAFNIGVVAYRLHIDLRYEIHFNRVADYAIFQNLQSGFGQSPGYLSIGLGYLIFR